MTPAHIIKDLGAKVSTDVREVIHRNMQLVDDQRAVFAITTYATASALASAAGAFVAMRPGVDPKEAVAGLLEIILPMTERAIQRMGGGG